MKQLLTLVCLLLASSFLWAQTVPQGINYQAVLRHDSGGIMPDKTVSVKVTIMDVDNKYDYYEEVHKVTSTLEGVIQMIIGAGVPTKGNFQSIPWSVAKLWANIAYDMEGRGQYETVGVMQLLSVPYAFYAETAGKTTQSEDGVFDEEGEDRNTEVIEKFWKTNGNELVPVNFLITNPEHVLNNQTLLPHFLGTTSFMPLQVKTADTLRAFMLPLGDFYLLKNQFIYGGLDVQGNVLFHDDLVVKGTIFSEKGEFFNLLVHNNARINNDLRVGNDLDLFGIARFNNTTESTTKDNGAVIIEGGVGIEKNANIGGNTEIDGTLGVDGMTSFFNTTQSLTKEDGAVVVEGGVGIEKNLNVGGNAGIGGTMDLSGKLTINDATQSTAPDNGALVIIGGAGIGKNLNIGGNTELEGTLGVDGISTLKNVSESTSKDDGSLIVEGGVGIEKNVNIGGNAEIDGTFGVDGEANFKNLVTFDYTVEGDQLDQTSYPVLIKGSKQGLAIDLTPAVNTDFQSHRGNNYISFWRDGAQKGRIEGMSTADLDPTGLVSLFVGMINSPNFGSSYDPFSQGLPTSISDLMAFSPGGLPSFTGPLGLSSVFSSGSLPSASFSFDDGLDFSPGSLPSISNIGSGTLNSIFNNGALPGLNFLSIEDFVNFQNPFSNPASYSQFTGFIQNFNGAKPASPAHTVWNTIKSSLMASGMYPADPTNFESQIFSNYTLGIVQQGISTLKAAITFISSLASIADPEDIFSQGVDLVVEITSITIYGAYADINLGVAYESGAGDYAEWLLRANPDEFISKGDVVGVIGGKVSKEFNHADKFMVVSTSPLLLGNMPENEREEQLSEKIAFMGQVPVKVQGEVKIGDYILPSGMGNGLGIAIAPDKMKARDYQRIIGVAWEDGQPDKFINLINTAVGVNHNDMARQMEQVQMTLNHIQETLVKLDPSYQVHHYETGVSSFSPKPLAYSVSPTHQNNVNSYFSGKEYTSRQEMIDDVKVALTEQAKININDVPIMKFVLDHPEMATTVASQFQDILNDMIHVRGQMVARVSE